MKKKISLIMVVVLMMSVICTGCGKPKDVNAAGETVQSYSLEGIKSKGKLILGTSAGYPPNEFHVMVEGKDTIVGYDIEIAKYIAEKLGVELEIKDMEFNSLLGGLSTGMLDVVLAGMVNKPDRDANFTKPYDLESIHKIVIRKSDIDKYKSLDDFNKAAVGAQTASIQKEIADDIEGAVVRELPEINTLIMELKTHKIDAMILANETASSYAENNDDIMVIEAIDLSHSSNGICIALKPGNDELTEYMDAIVDELLEAGLVQKWKAEAKILSDKESK